MANESETPVSKVTYTSRTYQDHPYDRPDIENQPTTILTFTEHPENDEDTPHVVQYRVEGEQLIKIKPTNENS